MNQELNSFALLVHTMRSAQNTYFEKAAKARKTQASPDWAAAYAVLKESKALEAKVDARIAAINPIVTPENVLPNA